MILDKTKCNNCEAVQLVKRESNKCLKCGKIGVLQDIMQDYCKGEPFIVVTPYDIVNDHTGIKTQIKEWETKIDNINKQLSTVFEESTLGDIRLIQDELDGISDEMMSINL